MKQSRHNLNVWEFYMLRDMGSVFLDYFVFAGKETNQIHLSSFSDNNNNSNNNDDDDDDCTNSKKACLIETAGTLRHVLNLCR